MRVLWRLAKLARPVAHWMALATLLGTATVACGIGLMATSAYIVSKAALQPSIADLQMAIVGVRFFGIARGISRYVERLASHEATFRLLARLRVWFYECLEPLAPARLMQYRSGDLLARIVADVETLENLYLRVLAPPAVALSVAVLAALLLGAFDPALALILLGFFAMTAAGPAMLARRPIRETSIELARVRAELNGLLVDGIQGAADLLAFGQERRHLERTSLLSRSLTVSQGRLAAIEGLQEASTGLMLNLATAAVLAVAVVLVSEAVLSGVFLATVILIVISSFEAILPLPTAFRGLEISLASGQRLFEMVDTEPEVGDPPVTLPLPDARSLRVEGLSFAYSDSHLPALIDIDFELAAQKTLAIVGPSGAGKSTLINLLLRFWDYHDGCILVGGTELRQIGQEDWRRMTAVVSQHTHLFNGTVHDNLQLARPGAGDGELVEAARQAQIHQFIESLPQGYDTWIGEQGLRLSGGERQRLAIARALLKDAPLLILDEPTAHLDPMTERKVMAGLGTLVQGRTTLIVTHRLVGLEDANEILVLQAGTISERGRHEELVEMEGLYYRMWTLQSEVLALR